MNLDINNKDVAITRCHTIQTITTTIMIYSHEAITRKLEKYDTLKTTITQQGWMVLPKILITTCIQGSIHTNTIQRLIELKIPPNIIYKLMESFSKIVISYLTHIILNKCKFENNKPQFPLHG